MRHSLPISGPSTRACLRLLAVAVVLTGVAARTAPAALAEGPNAIVALPTATSADACKDATLPANDDSSAGPVTLPFAIDLFGRTSTAVWVNNNGSVSIGGPVGGLILGQTLGGFLTPLIAPYLADVDTRDPGSTPVTYSPAGATYEGRPAFCVDWVNVGYNPHGVDRLNSFQLLLVDRSDTGAGNFDIYFDYDKIQWETAADSGGTIIGYTNAATELFELPGSPNGAFLDSDPGGLIHGSLGSPDQLGRYILPVRNVASPPAGDLESLVRSMDIADPLAGELAHRAHVAGARMAAGNEAGCRALDAFVSKVISAAGQDEPALTLDQASALVATAYSTETADCTLSVAAAPAAEAAVIGVLASIASPALEVSLAGDLRTTARQIGADIAAGETDSACSKAAAFGRRVDGQRHKRLTDDEADALVAAVSTVGSLLDC